MRLRRSSGTRICPTCFALLFSSASAFAHRRHCSQELLPRFEAHCAWQAEVVLSRAQRQALLVAKLQGVFQTDANASLTQVELGPSGGVQREDEFVIVAPEKLQAEKMRVPVGDAIVTEAADLPDSVEEDI